MERAIRTCTRVQAQIGTRADAHAPYTRLLTRAAYTARAAPPAGRGRGRVVAGQWATPLGAVARRTADMY
eukprot:COSAG06_NODE_47035_length_342_cov_0.967078_1_plen_69_part_10